MKPIIKVDHISKRYRLGGASHQTLREALSTAFKFRKQSSEEQPAGHNTLWALQDVSFDVMPGEVLGVIGHNGAGKSTLLKILSRVTEPTGGRAELHGRLGSLLEVGTGFHPELTGRENVYLGGALLGMTRAEIDRKFDAVVSFAEVEKFMDTPVKRYSSGMYVRLAFAVAAHMEPDILLIDEVLSVGDLGFQNKCFHHMLKLRQRGVTILLVSHALSTIQAVCQRSLYLDHGKVLAFGNTEDVINEYQMVVRQRAQVRQAAERERQHGTDPAGVILKQVQIFGEDGRERRNFRFGESIRVRMHLHSLRRIEAPLINFGIKRDDGVVVCNFNNWMDNFKIDYIEGECILEGWLPSLRLIPQHYQVRVIIWQRLRGYAESDLMQLRPLADRNFGDIAIEGLPLTVEDGVYQEPALKWVFTRGEHRVEFTDIGPDNLFAAYGRPGHANEHLAEAVEV